MSRLCRRSLGIMLLWYFLTLCLYLKHFDNVTKWWENVVFFCSFVFSLNTVQFGIRVHAMVIICAMFLLPRRTCCCSRPTSTPGRSTDPVTSSPPYFPLQEYPRCDRKHSYTHFAKKCMGVVWIVKWNTHKIIETSTRTGIRGEVTSHSTNTRAWYREVLVGSSVREAAREGHLVPAKAIDYVKFVPITEQGWFKLTERDPLVGLLQLYHRRGHLLVPVEVPVGTQSASPSATYTQHKTTNLCEFRELFDYRL